MRNTITRTFITVYADCTCYNVQEKKPYDAMILVPDSCINTNMAEKYLRKTMTGNDKLVTVNSLSKSSTLYGMEESDFIKFAAPVEARSKETRNMITKTVNAIVGTYVYMDMSSREIKERSVSVPTYFADKLDKYAKKIEQDGEKAITIENCKTVSALYAISEAVFRREAREMVDHQHYKE